MEQELLRELKRGTGFVGGRVRVYKAYRSGMTLGEFAKVLAHEYGVGGWSCIGKGWFAHDGRGIEYGETFENKSLYKWTAVAKEIGRLIDQGNYLTESEKIEVGDIVPMTRDGQYMMVF